MNHLTRSMFSNPVYNSLSFSGLVSLTSFGTDKILVFSLRKQYKFNSLLFKLFSTNSPSKVSSNNIYVYQSLQYTFGVGKVIAKLVCAELGINPNTPINAISRYHRQKLFEQIERDFFVDMELKRLMQQDIKRCIHIGCYRGLRHHDKLPCRGQRTHTNARTTKRIRIGASEN